MLLPSHQVVEFGPFNLDLTADALYRDGELVTLRPQALLALKALVIHSGQHLDHDRMIQQAWSGVNVSKHTVTVTISEVRRTLGEFGDWIHAHPRLGYCLEVPPSEELLRIGWHHLNRRTREGMEKAVRCLESAAKAGAGARAIEGASRAYLLLGAYGMRRADDCYPRFLELHRQLAGLQNYTPELRLDRAMGLNLYERRFAEAEQDILQALEEQPALGAAYAHLAMLYASWGQNGKAMIMLERARSSDVLAPPLALAEITVRLCARDYEGAVEAGWSILELHPHVPTVVAIHASALQLAGHTEAALRRFDFACALSPDVPWYRAMQGVCQVQAGQRAAAEAMLSELLRLRETDYVDGYHLAQLLDALGDREGAFRELERSATEGCPLLTMLNVDPLFDQMREHPGFTALAERISSGASWDRAERLP